MKKTLSALIFIFFLGQQGTFFADDKGNLETWGAQLISKPRVLYGKFVVSMKPSSHKGTLSTFCTYVPHDSTNKHWKWNEILLECAPAVKQNGWLKMTNQGQNADGTFTEENIVTHSPYIEPSMNHPRSIKNLDTYNLANPDPHHEKKNLGYTPQTPSRWWYLPTGFFDDNVYQNALFFNAIRPAYPSLANTAKADQNTCMSNPVLYVARDQKTKKFLINPYDGFHEYTIEWTPQGISWYVDSDQAWGKKPIFVLDAASYHGIKDMNTPTSLRVNISSTPTILAALPTGKTETYYKYVKYYPTIGQAKTDFDSTPSFVSDFSQNTYTLDGKKVSFNDLWTKSHIGYGNSIQNNVSPASTTDRGLKTNALKLSLSLKRGIKDENLGTMYWPFNQEIIKTSDPDSDKGADEKWIEPSNGEVSIIVMHQLELPEASSYKLPPDVKTLPDIVYGKPYENGLLPSKNIPWMAGTLYNTIAQNPRWVDRQGHDLITLSPAGFAQKRYHIKTDYNPQTGEGDGKALTNVRFPCTDPCPLAPEELGKITITLNGKETPYYGHMYYCGMQPPSQINKGEKVPHKLYGYDFSVQKGNKYYILIKWTPQNNRQ